MLPSFDSIKTCKTELDLEDAFERLVDTADRRFTRGNYSQVEYDAWLDAATEAFDLRLWEIHREKTLLVLNR